MTTQDKPNTASIRSSMDAVECDEALCGLARFAAWWNKFKAQECQGIKASFQLDDLMTARFRFRKGSIFFERTYDLTRRFALGSGVICNLRRGVSTLRERADASKTNESES